MDIEAFILESQRTDTSEKLQSLISTAIGFYGYQRLICFSDIGPLEGIDAYDAQKIAEYNQRNLKKTDPILHLYFHHPLPFTQNQICLSQLSAEQRDAMEFHREGGVQDGLHIPVGGVSTTWVGITLACDGSNARIDKMAQRQLYALVHQYALRRTQLQRRQLNPSMLNHS